MNKIKFNNTEFEVETYNKSTYFGGETITSNANCNIVVTDANALNALVGITITSIQITHDDNLIYNLSNISARIDNINEYLNMDRMGTSLNIVFDQPSNE